MWTTELLLDCIFCSGIKSSWQIEGNKSLEIEHAKIIALLKAFDLYVVEKRQVFDKRYKKIIEKDAFDIEDFYCGNFIKRRSKEEISELLEQLAEDKIIRRDFRLYPKDDCSCLSWAFCYLVDYRFTLQQSIDTLSFEHVTGTFILYQFMKQLEQQAEKIDSALLKIIGYKKPVPEEVLIRKYGFPETERLTDFSSLEEIIDAL